MKKALLFSLLLINIPGAHGISLVYSMKIRRVFRVADKITDIKALLVATALPIIYKRDRHIIDQLLNIDIYDKRLIGGSLFNIRALSSSHRWWAEITTGVEKETAHATGSSLFTISRAGFDDVVFSVGYNMFPIDRMQLVLYGLGGVPTKTTVTALEAQDTLVGTRFFSAGVGGECSYAFISSLKQSLIGIIQSRFLHFFDRGWFPVLSKGSKIQPGNATDALFALQYRYKRDIIEAGYNATFFTNQGLLLPTGHVSTSLFVRNTFYMTYSHVLLDSLKRKKPWVLGLGFNIGTGTKFSTKIVAAWVNITKVF